MGIGIVTVGGISFAGRDLILEKSSRAAELLPPTSSIN